MNINYELGAAGCKWSGEYNFCCFLSDFYCKKYNLQLELHSKSMQPLRCKQCVEDASNNLWAKIIEKKRQKNLE